MADAGKGQIIVTGASRGIGAAIMVELDRRGFSVVGLSRSGETEVGRGVACDVTDEATLAAAIHEIGAAIPLAGLVNNAGRHEFKSSAKLMAAEFESLIRINTTAALVASREAYPFLKQAGGGLIVNIGSFYDKLGVPENVAYCASKAALGAMTRCLAAEWARDGIRVINIAPGYVETDLNRDWLHSEKAQTFLKRRVPMGRAATTGEVAGLAGALFVEKIGYLTGETIYLDGGHGMNL